MDTRPVDAIEDLFDQLLGRSSTEESHENDTPEENNQESRVLGEGPDRLESDTEEDTGQPEAEETVPEAPDEVQELRSQVRSLMAANQQLLDMLKEKEGATEVPKTPVRLKEPEVLEFVKDEEELLNLTQDRTQFNKFLTSLVRGIREQVLQEVGASVTPLVDQRLNLYGSWNAFLSSNRDLFEGDIPEGSDPATVRDARMSVFLNLVQEVQSQHPEWAGKNITKIYEEAGRKLRNALGRQMKNAKKPEPVPQASGPKRSPFARPAGSRSSVPGKEQPPSLADEVDALKAVVF